LSFYKLKYNYLIINLCIYIIKVDPKIDPENILINQQMLPCPETSLLSSNMSRKKSTTPLSFVLTEFHILLLYTDHVKGVSLLNQELIFEDIYNDVRVKEIFKQL
jgi:hypothetical protein